MSGERAGEAREATDAATAREWDGLLAAAEPTEPRPLGELIERLRAGGQLIAIEGRVDGDAAPGAGSSAGGSDLTVRGVTYDSRHVLAESLFVAIRGGRSDGHDFVSAAADRGVHLRDGRLLEDAVLA